MKLPYIRVAQLNEEQSNFLQQIAMPVALFADNESYIIKKDGKVYGEFDCSEAMDGYYPVSTYEEFVEMWDQIKLLNLL